jgi:hypothetical protein
MMAICLNIHIEQQQSLQIASCEKAALTRSCSLVSKYIHADKSASKSDKPSLVKILYKPAKSFL